MPVSASSIEAYRHAHHHLARVDDAQTDVSERCFEPARRRQGIRRVVVVLFGWHEPAHCLVHDRALRALGRCEQAGNDPAGRSEDSRRLVQRAAGITRELERVDPEHSVE